jgi:membrane protease YdiL (CAAX protease family)
MLRTYLKYTQPWQQFLVFIGITLGVSAVTLLIATPLIQSAFNIPTNAILDLANGKISHPNIKQYLIVSQSVSVFCLFIIPAYLFSYFADEQPTQYLGLHRFPKKYFALFIIPLVFLSIPASNIIGIFNQMLPLPKSLIESENMANKAIEKLVVAHSVTDLIVSLIVVALFAAISEELFFRSILQRIMIQWSNNAWKGIIFTAILFSAFHMQFSGFFVRFGLGVLLGALYWYSGSIYTAIAFHFLHNAAGVLIVYFRPSMDVNKAQTTDSFIAMAVVGVIAIVAIVYILISLSKKSTTNYHQLYPKQPSFFE